MNVLLICSITYIFFGFTYLLIPVPEWYVMLSIYLLFKWIFNYRTCTLSYYEVKLRNVQINEGFLYQFLESVVDLRYNKYIFIIYLIQILIICKFYSNRTYNRLYM
jgi:hypothetical protein